MGSIQSMFWRDKCETNSLTHNSMAPMPKGKYINYARQVRKHDSVFGSFKKPLSLKQREQVEGYRFDSYYDKFNH
jgi:hypothetical protein|tara:strand:- start:101 stop:325 length:225 start_codon:yes stop_codon:yes gene_type:complete